MSCEDPNYIELKRQHLITEQAYEKRIEALEAFTQQLVDGIYATEQMKKLEAVAKAAKQTHDCLIYDGDSPCVLGNDCELCNALSTLTPEEKK